MTAGGAACTNEAPEQTVGIPERPLWTGSADDATFATLPRHIVAIGSCTGCSL